MAWREVRCVVCKAVGMARHDTHEPMCPGCGAAKRKLLSILPSAEQIAEYRRNNLNKFINTLTDTMKKRGQL